MIFLHATHRHILSPCHDIPLYDPDCLFHCISAAPAGTWLPHDFAPEDYNPLSCATSLDSATSGIFDALGGSSGGASEGTKVSAAVPKHFSTNCPWSLGLLPQTRQDPDDTCDELPNVPGDERPIEVIEISGSEIGLGEVVSVKPLAAFAVASPTGKSFAWKVVAISGNCPVASVLESMEDVEASFPGSLNDIREWLRTRDVLQSNGRHAADLPFVSEPLGPERAHAVVARANATWQLFVDQNVPAEPWAPPAAVLNGSFLESIWKRKYMGDCAPSAAIPVSQPAHLQQQQQAENAAQKAAAEAVSGALVEEKPANGKWGGKLRGIFRTKSGRLMPSRLGGGSSDKCPIPKASTSHCSNSNSSSSNSSSSSGSGGGGGGGGGGSSAGAGFGSGMGSLRSSGSSPESNLLRQQIPSSGHVWSHAESGESREAFGDRLRRATSLDPGQLEPGSGKSSGLGGAVSGHGKPPVQHRRCESFEHYAEPSRRSWVAVPSLRHAEAASGGRRAASEIDDCATACRGKGGADAPPLPSASCHIDRLPDELVATILRVVFKKAQSLSDIASLLLTCRRFYDICRPASHWSLPASASVEALLPTDAAHWTPAVQRFLLSAATEGNIEAIYIAGMISFYCIGNHWAGARLLAQAAECGHGPATYSLAIINFHGSGGTARDTNPQAGVDLCWRAAKLGFMPALQELGHCFVDGYGVSQRISLGKILLQHASAAMEGTTSSCRCGNCPLSPSSPFPSPFSFPCSAPAPPHSPAAPLTPSATVPAAPAAPAVAQATAPAVAQTTAAGTQAARTTEAQGAAAPAAADAQDSGKKALQAWRSRRFGRSFSWPPSGGKLKHTKVVPRQSGAPISAGAEAAARWNAYLSARMEEEGTEAVQRGGELDRVMRRLQQRETTEKSTEQQIESPVPPPQQQQQQLRQGNLNQAVEPAEEGREGTASAWRDLNQPCLTLLLAPPRDTLYELFGGERPAGWSIEEDEEEEDEEEDAEEGEEEESGDEEECEGPEEDGKQRGAQEDLSQDHTDLTLSHHHHHHHHHPQQGPQPHNEGASLNASSAHLTQILLSSLLTYTHNHTHCPLSLQLAFPLPSPPHRIHSFLATWHAIHPLPAGRRCCGSPACGRPETRVGEFRTCVSPWDPARHEFNPEARYNRCWVSHASPARGRVSTAAASSGDNIEAAASEDAAAEPHSLPSDAPSLKAALYAGLEGLDRGIFGMPSAKRADLHAIIERLEELNPRPAPTEHIDEITGEWRLLYSTIAILGSKRTKLGLRDFISLGDFIQIVDKDTRRAANAVEFSVRGLGLLSGKLTIEATYTVSSPTRVDINFESSSIVPDQLNKLFEKNYDLLLRIFNPDGWLEITYVDDTVRIGRDDKGNIFVVERQLSKQ
ncbi:unnamed protein product [Closterium sp. NIES-54]